MSAYTDSYLVGSNSVSYSEPSEKNKNEEDNSFLGSHRWGVRQVVGFEEDQQKHENWEENGVVVLYVEDEMKWEGT